MSSLTTSATPDDRTVGRRAVLGATAATLAGSAGCVRRVRSLVNRDGPTQVSLSIKTVPADADPRATRIARDLAEKLDRVGVAARVVPMARESLLRDVLVNQRFDLYVGRYPARADPDFLRPLLHSRFGPESGWQNPFGYANLDVDELLVRQRRLAGADRDRVLAALQKEIARDKPFSVVAFPDEIRAVRDDRFGGWATAEIHTPLGYLSIEPRPDGTDRPLRMALSDARAMENLNPIAAPFRDAGVITGLLYDPLGRRIDGRVRPWLADAWHWQGPPRQGATLVVRLRSALRWHDGERLTAEDVAFTYRFLRDTSLGAFESPVPAPLFRGASSLVTGAEAIDDRTVRLRFRPVNRQVARRALTPPVLPKHVWRSRSEEATVAGLDAAGAVTKALVWSNRDPVGSGPLRLEQLTVREALTLAEFEDHFLDRESLPRHLAPYRGGFAPEALTFVRVPSGSAGVALVRDGDLDATATGVQPSDVPAIGRSDAVDLQVDRSRAFYHVGFNTRRSPFANPRFRRAVARLIDEEYLVEEVFGGYAVPAASPLVRHEAMAPTLAWADGDPSLPFPGANGTLDVGRAKRAFRRAGYRYGSDGRLLTS